MPTIFFPWIPFAPALSLFRNGFWPSNNFSADYSFNSERKAVHISWSLSIFFCVCKESFRYRRTFPFAGIVYARSPFREKKENGDSFQDLKVILEFTTGQGYHFFSIFLYRYSKPKSEHHLHKTKDQNHRKKKKGKEKSWKKARERKENEKWTSFASLHSSPD